MFKKCGLEENPLRLPRKRWKTSLAEGPGFENENWAHTGKKGPSPSQATKIAQVQATIQKAKKENDRFQRAEKEKERRLQGQDGARKLKLKVEVRRRDIR